ncbi:MAG: ABC transporter permease [Anaerolineae bacterium]|nr:ABC transporter permease [Anaerolineae bacterium]
MNIFIHELKANFKSLLIWSVVVILLISEAFAEFSAMAGNPAILKVMDEFPPAVLEAFGMHAFNMTTVTGYFGVVFIYFALFLTLAAVMWGSDIISKEERDKTVEFALSLPVTRRRLLTAKILAAGVNSLCLLLLTWAVTLAHADKYQPDSQFYQFVALSMLALFIMQMIFLAVGFLLGAALKPQRHASSVAAGLLLASYFLAIVTELNAELAFLKYAAPFKYFNPIDLLHAAELDRGFVWLSAVIIAVCLVGAYASYQKRDLHI